MAAALLAETAILPHWVPVRWVPQFSFLILLFAALKYGARAGVLLGLALGAGQSMFSAMPAGTLVGVYAILGGTAGSAKKMVFLESPLAQWLSPIAFGLLTELAFFWMMPWDDRPLGFGDYTGMIRASNLPVTWLLSGFVYVWCDRRIFLRKRS